MSKLNKVNLDKASTLELKVLHSDVSRLENKKKQECEAVQQQRLLIEHTLNQREQMEEEKKIVDSAVDVSEQNEPAKKNNDNKKAKK